ncbi:MAG: hypothetical protein HZY73_11655 [Micropruina sp.]|nr:MAG: hypothetical protein HZY73_11655 [Micropruina sp.]
MTKLTAERSGDRGRRWTAFGLPAAAGQGSESGFMVVGGLYFVPVWKGQQWSSAVVRPTTVSGPWSTHKLPARARDNTLALFAFDDGRLLLAMGRDSIEAGARWWVLDPDFTNRRALTPTVYAGPSRFIAFGNRLYLVPSTSAATPLWYSEDGGQNWTSFER